MVLREFTEEEKEIIFSDLKLKSYLINSIRRKLEDFEEELPELCSEDSIINLALEYFLEALENPDKEEDNETFIYGVEQLFLMVNFDFIKANVNYEIEDVPEEVLKESYEEYLEKPSDNAKLNYHEFLVNYYNTKKTVNILANAKRDLKAKAEELAYLDKRIVNIESKYKELQEQLQ